MHKIWRIDKTFGNLDTGRTAEMTVDCPACQTTLCKGGRKDIACICIVCAACNIILILVMLAHGHDTQQLHQQLQSLHLQVGKLQDQCQRLQSKVDRTSPSPGVDRPTSHIRHLQTILSVIHRRDALKRHKEKHRQIHGHTSVFDDVRRTKQLSTQSNDDSESARRHIRTGNVVDTSVPVPDGSRNRRSVSQSKKLWVQIEGSYGRISHPDGDVIRHWRYAAWVDRHSKENIRLGSDGVITIHKTGVYQVFAQLTFAGRTSYGFVIVKMVGTNTEPIATCHQSIPTPDDHTARDHTKLYTCNTAGLFKFEEEDKLYIQDSYLNRHIFLTSNASYLNIVKL